MSKKVEGEICRKGGRGQFWRKWPLLKMDDRWVNNNAWEDLRWTITVNDYCSRLIY